MVSSGFLYKGIPMIRTNRFVQYFLAHRNVT